MAHVLEEWVDFLVARDLHVFALHGIIAGHCSCWRGPECDRPGKHPLAAEWQTEEIDLRSTPTWANLGVRTGSDLLVIDIDDPTLARHEDFPPTFTVSTSKGFHLYYRTQPNAKRFRTMVRWRPGVDIRAEGGLVVAPPSLHISTVRYMPTYWIDRPIAPLPDEFYNAIPAQTTRTIYTRPDNWTPTAQDAPNYGPMAQMLLEDMTNAQQGERNATLFRLACRLTTFINAGMLRPMWLEELAQEAEAAGLGSAEIARTIASASGGLKNSSPNPQRTRVLSSPKDGG